MVTMTQPPAMRLTPLDITCNATPTVAAQVRLMLDYRLSDWGLTASRYGEVRANLFLVVSELVTNAVEETPDHEIRIRCFLDFKSRTIRVGVWDSSDRIPKTRMPDLTLETLDLREKSYDENGGWGLPLVEALSESCGVEPTSGGKWVWANIKVGG